MTYAVQIRTGYETVQWSKKMQSALTSVTKNPEWWNEIEEKKTANIFSLMVSCFFY